MKNIVSPFAKTLDISLSPQQIFALIAQQNDAVFLDSGNSEHENSHYDIIAFSPITVISYQDGEATIKQRTKQTTEQTTKHTSDPFALANEYWRNTKPAKLCTELPFNGGIIGWWSYDLGRSIEKLPEQAKAGFNCPQMYIGLYDCALIFDNHSQTWYALDYQPELKRIDAVLNAQPKPPQKFQLTSDWRSNMTKADYQQKFDRVKQYLRDGDCYQINLAQRFNASFEGNLWQAYLALVADNKAPFSAFIKTEQHTLLSISPERFLQLHDKKIETKPIKGTLRRGNNEQEDQQLANQLQQSEKDRAENLMIVDLLRNDISKVAAKASVAVPKLFEIESFPAVHHLVSTVTGTLADNKTPFDLLKGAFPGGSITGAPKVRAMEIIEELEPHRRHVYCGSIGYIDWAGNMDTNIAIRTLIGHENQLYCWAGGGLVMDSNVDAEYQETFDKVSRILPLLSQCT